jgi:cytochrome c
MIAALLAAVTLVYIRGVCITWIRAGVGRGVSVRQAMSFLFGLIVVAAALVSPLDRMADDLFAAHMAQHVPLAAIAPPFLVFGAPIASFAWALPARWRRPIVAFVRRRHGIRWLWLAALFLTALQTGALGALITLSHRLLYPAQTIGAGRWGLTPMDDQTLAGLIMWVAGGLIYVVAMSVLFVRWLTPPSGASICVPLLFACVAGCSGAGASIVPGGDAARGKRAIEAAGCGACHTIPGARYARGDVGPPLAGIGRRFIIAGKLANTPDNMIRWIEDPPAIEPGTAMPNLGVTSPMARDMAAYLYTLR